MLVQRHAVEADLFGEAHHAQMMLVEGVPLGRIEEVVGIIDPGGDEPIRILGHPRVVMHMEVVEAGGVENAQSCLLSRDLVL